MKPKSKLLSLLLTICLVVGLMPTAAFAAGTDTGKAIQLVDSGTAANIGGGQADNIYFGTYQQSSDGSGGYNTDPIKWRVLENADGQLFLLSDQNLDVFQYHTDQQALITLHCHLSNCRPFGRQFFCLRRASRRRTLWFQGFSGASFDGIIDGSMRGRSFPPKNYWKRGGTTVIYRTTMGGGPVNQPSCRQCGRCPAAIRREKP